MQIRSNYVRIHLNGRLYETPVSDPTAKPNPNRISNLNLFCGSLHLPDFKRMADYVNATTYFPVDILNQKSYH